MIDSKEIEDEMTKAGVAFTSENLVSIQTIVDSFNGLDFEAIAAITVSVQNVIDSLRLFNPKDANARVINFTLKFCERRLRKFNSLLLFLSEAERGRTFVESIVENQLNDLKGDP